MKKLFVLLLTVLIISCTTSLYKKSEDLLNSGDYDNAIAEYEKIIEKYPDDYNAYFGIGQAYRYKQEFLQAIQYYDHVLKLKPEWEPAVTAKKETVIERGEYYLEQRRYSNALEIFNSVLEEDPDNLDIHLKIAQINEKRKEFDEALKIYEQILIKHPGNKTASAAVEKFKNREDAFNENYASGQKLYRQKKFEQAGAAYETAFNSRPDSKEAEYKTHISKGRHSLYMFEKDRKVFTAWNAIEHFTYAARIFPDKAEPHYFLGIAHNKRDKNDYDAAINEFKQALDLEKNFEFAKDCKKRMDDLVKLKKFWGK